MCTVECYWMRSWCSLEEYCRHAGKRGSLDMVTQAIAHMANRICGDPEAFEQNAENFGVRLCYFYVGRKYDVLEEV